MIAGCRMGDLFGGGSSKQQKVKATPEEKALKQISVEAYNRYKTVYQPVVDKFIAKAKNVTRPVEITTSRARAATEAAFAPAIQNLEKADMAYGAEPGSGRFSGDVGDALINKGTAGGLGVSSARVAGKDVAVGRLNQLISYGQGKAGSAVNGLSNAASAAQQQAIQDAALSAQSRADTINTIGSAAAGLYGAYKGGGGGGLTGPGSKNIFGSVQAPAYSNSFSG